MYIYLNLYNNIYQIGVLINILSIKSDLLEKLICLCFFVYLFLSNIFYFRVHNPDPPSSPDAGCV